MIFFFKQKTAYEMRISDWSSDVCSSDLAVGERAVGWLPATPIQERSPKTSGAPQGAQRDPRVPPDEADTSRTHSSCPRLARATSNERRCRWITPELRRWPSSTRCERASTPAARPRWEERRVGKEGGRRGRTRGAT